MSTERGVRSVCLLGCLLCAPVLAAEQPSPPPLPAQAAHQVVDGGDLWSRLLPDEPSPVRSLDPAIFTELSPVSASDPAVRLPEDQRDAEFQRQGDGR